SGIVSLRCAAYATVPAFRYAARAGAAPSHPPSAPAPGTAPHRHPPECAAVSTSPHVPVRASAARQTAPHSASPSRPLSRASPPPIPAPPPLTQPPRAESFPPTLPSPARPASSPAIGTASARNPASLPSRCADRSLPLLQLPTGTAAAPHADHVHCRES